MKYTTQDCYGNYLQDKLVEIFNNKEDGFFIELGANDGLTQSNTAFLEKYLNWKGILIEPSIKGYNSCKINRINSICLNCACVSDDYNLDYVEGDFDGHCMSSINGKRLNRNNLSSVKAMTLNKILNVYNVTSIDFLSLDTEGYELNILNGLDLKNYRPKYILIELYPDEYDKVFKYLNSNNYNIYKCKYTNSNSFTNYNKTTNPSWDGTHNDYLFVDSTL
jgi:FkbM family methyltransferase